MIKLAQPVYEEECEHSDDDQFNNRGSELDDDLTNERVLIQKSAIVEKQISECSYGSD